MNASWLAAAESIGTSLREQLAVVEAEQTWGSVTEVMDSHLEQLHQLECWGEQNPLPSSVFWREAGDVLQRGSLQHHARFKPHGYAGDYEMLERLITCDARGEGLPLAFDRYFINHPAPQAVRNRNVWIADRIVELFHASSDSDPFRIVSLGSGPAWDLDAALATLSHSVHDRIEVVLLDLDGAALEFASSRLRGFAKEAKIETRRDNLFRLPRRADTPELAADFIFCTGLFDYLPDADAVAMLKWMERHRKPDGAGVMMNFSPINGSRAYMEWAGMWYLIHRTESDMAELAARAGFRDWTIGAEPSGIDLILQWSEGALGTTP